MKRFGWLVLILAGCSTVPQEPVVYESRAEQCDRIMSAPFGSAESTAIKQEFPAFFIKSCAHELIWSLNQED